jgi:hypothetical protein
MSFENEEGKARASQFDELTCSEEASEKYKNLRKWLND